MAKPHFQAGQSQNSGTADQSALPNGEAQGGDPKAAQDGDWGLGADGSHPAANWILGSIFVLVLAGVFSFIVYKKLGEAKFAAATEPLQAGATEAPANGTNAPKPAVAADPFEQPTSGAGTKAVAAKEPP